MGCWKDAGTLKEVEEGGEVCSPRSGVMGVVAEVVGGAGDVIAMNWLVLVPVGDGGTDLLTYRKQ